MSIVFAVMMTALVIIFALCLRRGLRRFRIKKNYTAAIDAPSVSVCIPARNETHAMTECLELVLASDYRKMEVIVYDDSSIDDTSYLVRSFAHAGVRFVPGSELPEGWLGRNHALNVLADEASGTYIVFMDVDTHVTPTTISQLVGYGMTEGVDMVSVIPGRDGRWRANVLFGSLRYFWELILSREKRPATSGALWMIRRRTLIERFEGLSAFKSDVVPELSLASALGTTAYHCLVTNHKLGVTYAKKWSSQVETSRRILFPMAGSRFWKAMVAVSLLLLLNVPLLVILSGLFFGWSIIQIMATWYMFAFMAIYAVYTSHMWQRWWWAGGLLWPLVVAQELGLMVWSIWGYARGTVTWKGRPVAKPVFKK